ncbi:MAG: hypothetical protein FWD94_03985 [Treponema sp.]|jgi:hypothetical protein|nr:hypothetical protein [Treponema sp.]
MRNLILVLIAMIAVVVFIRAYEGSQSDLAGTELRRAAAESSLFDGK